MFFSGCGSGGFRNLEEPDFLLDLGPKNLNNWDNKIYKPRAQFVYSLTIFDSEGNKRFLHLAKKFATVSDELVAKIDSSKSADYIDTIVLSVFENTANSALGIDQTIIKYDYHNREDRLGLGEITGLIEDSTKVFLHPPRNHFLVNTEINPFPYVKLPIDRNDYWELDFSIPNWFMDINNKLKDSSLKITYKRTSEVSLRTAIGEVRAFEYLAMAKNSEIEIRSWYYFNSEMGFVRMQFQTLDGYQIVLDLEKIIDDL